MCAVIALVFSVTIEGQLRKFMANFTLDTFGPGIPP